VFLNRERLVGKSRLQQLLDDGCDVKFADEEGRSALYFAAREEPPGVVEMLLKAGAAVEIFVLSYPNMETRRPFTSAGRARRDSLFGQVAGALAPVLPGTPNPLDDLLAGHEEIASVLRAAGACEDGIAAEALIAAVEGGRTEDAVRLVSPGMDVNSTHEQQEPDSLRLLQKHPGGGTGDGRSRGSVLRPSPPAEPGHRDVGG